ncbi:hypothetical protein FI667_g7203, partial [Globisporangium splendens]
MQSAEPRRKAEVSEGIGSVEGDSQREISDSGESESSSSASSVSDEESSSGSSSEEGENDEGDKTNAPAEDEEEEESVAHAEVEAEETPAPAAAEEEEVSAAHAEADDEVDDEEGAEPSESEPSALRRSKRIAQLSSEEASTHPSKKQVGEDREYRLVWGDGSLVWKKLSELKGCPILVQTYDRYLEKYPSKEITYAQFITRDVPSMRLMGANDHDDCAVHAFEMAFEMIGLKEEAGRLQKL